MSNVTWGLNPAKSLLQCEDDDVEGGGGESSPERSMGSLTSPFFTWSDSPVSELSSTFKSLLCISIPSAGNKSPETHNDKDQLNEQRTRDVVARI